jgi:hypothetical protein
VLLDLKAWKDNKDREKVCWINGMAGTGKTTIMTSLCASLEKKHQLGASFFCTRLIPVCRNVKYILPTVAYQLARFSGPFKAAFVQVLEQDPDVHTKLPQVQFQKMILEPLQKVKDSLPATVLVAIDALDECEDENGVEQILEVLLENTLKLPIKFLVSSRPEQHIKDRIRECKLNQLVVLHELDEKMVKADIKTFLQIELEAMRVSFTSDQLEVLAERAGTLFIYAATLIRYIKGKNALERLGAILNGPCVGRKSENQTKEIDQLYENVLVSAFKNLEQHEKDRMKLVLHTTICAQEPLTVKAMAILLEIECDKVVAALEPLQSVLHISESDATGRVSTLHASFPDYIHDPERSKHFACNGPNHNSMLAHLCFRRIAQNQPQFNIFHLPSSHKFDEGIQDIKERTKHAIPSDLMYACQYWATHLERGVKSSEQVKGSGQIKAVHDFLSQRLLLWIEVLNLTKKIANGAGQLHKAMTWLQVSNDRSFDHSETSQSV